MLICKGNLWHVCAVNHLKKDPNTQFEFIQCMIRNMSRGSPKEVALMCSPATSIYETISSCADGPEGESSMLSPLSAIMIIIVLITAPRPGIA